MIDVSVILPAYNAARFIRRAVDSALAQDGVSVEVIAVNDASKDDTLAVLRELAQTRPGLRVLDNAANLGPGGTRNAGIAAAQGRWIAILDADDAFAPGRLARLVSVAEGQGAGIVADLPVFYDMAAGQAARTQLPASGAVQEVRQADFLEPDSATGLDFGLLKPMFRADLRDRWHYAEGVRHGEDFELYFDLTGQGERFLLLHEALYVFSTRIGEISGSFSPGSVTDVDYRGIAAQSRRLAARADLDAGMRELLAVREANALRANRRYGWTALRKRDKARLFAWLKRDPANRRDMLAMVMAKLRGHRGLPD
ncbi:glycosyltransferase family 2 protein [Cereibacter sp. SYSU M97828]|nr:glycosyltransferase family 2 protein [Cereibacter flavus]